VSAVVALAVVLADQWTKRRIEAALGPEAPTGRIDLVGEWFALEYAQNRGAAFGLFGGSPEVVTAAAVLILVGVIAYAIVRHHASGWFWAGIGLVVGGAVGNLIDRLRLGYVVDFVAVGPWPNFNVADAAISVGVACLAIDTLTRPGTAPSGETGARTARVGGRGRSR